MIQLANRTLIILSILCSSLLALPGRTIAEEEVNNQRDSQTNRQEYIIVLGNQGVNRSANERAQVIERYVTAYGGELLYEYGSVINGFAATMSGEALDAIQDDLRVEFVEENNAVYASATQNPVPSWGLDRLDQTGPVGDNVGNNASDNTYQYNYDGTGVTAYVIDTGIYYSHPDFGSRVLGHVNFARNNPSGGDCNGHGTHVAGTVAGTTYGVAKNANLVSIRVLDCQGSGSDASVIAGVDWVTANHVKPAVANLSLGGSPSRALDRAVTNLHNAGVPVAVAAGNSNINACRVSPSRAAAAITVGATTSSDGRASYSNYGSCVDIFAPGSGITSAFPTNTNVTISGTSMASPHVAGAAALYLQQHPTATSGEVTSYLTGSALPGVLSNIPSGSPNLLLHIPLTTDPAPGETPADTPEETPADTPGETPADTPEETPIPSSQTVYVSSTSGGRVQEGRFADEDILAYDISNDVWSIFFDGSDVGLGGRGARDVDAFHVLDNGDILLSINGDTTIDGLGPVDDADILLFTPGTLGTSTNGTLELYLDASEFGLSSRGEDVDAIHRLENGDLLVSTKGRFSVPGLSGRDEDMIRLSQDPNGVDFTWSLYFDGSDVALHNRYSEDVYGAWVDEQSGNVYLTTQGAFSVPEVDGIGSDIFVCTGEMGDPTSCTFELMWSGSDHGFGAEIIDGLSLSLDGTSEATRVYGIFAADFSQHGVDEAEEVEDESTDEDDPADEIYLPLIQ